MTIQVTTVYFLLFVYFVTVDSSIRKGSIINNSNLINTKTHNYNNIGVSMYKPRFPENAPIDYLTTPNFDAMLLSEEKSDPTWRKYSELFQPKDLSNAPQIEVNYGGHAATFADHFRNPTIRLDRSEVEAILASLGGKKHIIVLHPRNCKSHSAMRRVEQTTLDEFENEFLPKLLQQLHKRSNTLDPVVDHILSILDKDEQKMLDDLRKTFEYYPSQYPGEMYSSGYTAMRKKPIARNQYSKVKSRTPISVESRKDVENVLFKDNCNEGYVFLVENQQNSMDPRSLNALLLRVLKVVTQES